jgi:hypothetical protein
MGNNMRNRMGIGNMSLAVAETVWSWANWFLVAALVVGLISTYLIVISGNVKEAALKRDLAEAAKAASEANARAAEARLELERLKMPRSLSRAQQDSFRDRLLVFRGTSIDIFRYGDTPEIVFFSNMLFSVLREAGWSLREWNITGSGAVVGILVITKHGADENILRAANELLGTLQASGLDAKEWPADTTWGEFPSSGGYIVGPSLDEKTAAPIRILIGAKP